MRRRTLQWRRLLWLILVAITVPGMTGAQDYPRYPALGSSFVPLDSWVYPALEKLAALGYVSTALVGLKPWTRTECARLTDEAGDALRQALREDRHPEEQVVQLHAALEREFAYEIEALGGGRHRIFRLESVYARVMSLSGSPLTDGYHFGQTVSYDFGRPLRRGTNALVGSSFRTSGGPLALYVRAEYQHAPSAPPLSDAVRNVIALRDGVPLQPAQRFNPVGRMLLLDSYFSLNWKNWQISAGKQSLVWAPGPGGSLLLSNNAEPIPMLRLTRVVPFRPRSFLRFLGPMRMDQFVGRLHGHSFVPNPYFYGQKVSFKPVPSLELGFGRTVILGGRGGDPITWVNFFRSFLGQSDPRTGGKPGDTRVGMDWTFYIPRTHHYIVFYGELFADDDYLPVGNPKKNPFRPGLYLTRFPGLPKLDLHVEVTSTEVMGFRGRTQGALNYTNFVYRDGYTYRGNLLGNTVGREGHAVQLWSNYSFSPRNILQFGFTHTRVNPDFIPGGGTWQDYNARLEIHLRSGFYVKSFLQYEHIRKYPILFHGPVNNITASVELGFAPEQGKP